MQDVGAISCCQTVIPQNVTLTICTAVHLLAGVGKQTVTALVLSVLITEREEVGLKIYFACGGRQRHHACRSARPRQNLTFQGR